MALQEELEQQGNYLFKYRGTLPLIILVLGALVYVQSHINGNALYNYLPESTYIWICLGVCFLGQIIRIFTVGFTPKNTSGRNTAEQVADEVNTTGIYSMVRHPLYVGNYFMWLGICLLMANLWFAVAFTLLYWVYYERIMFAEEQFLRGKFGEKYLTWASRTPAFIPNFSNRSQAKLDFSWKKILKSEKNGIAAIFILFYFFEVLGYYLNDEALYQKTFMFYAMVISTVVYFILKFLKRSTNVLQEEGR